MGYEVDEKGRFITPYKPIYEDMGVVSDRYSAEPKGISGGETLLKEEKPHLTYPEWHGKPPEQPGSAYVRRKKLKGEKGETYEPYNRKGH